MIRLVLAEDQAMVRGALAALLRLETDLSLLAEAGDGDAAWQAVQTHRPALLVTDIEMPGMTGLDLAQRIRDAALPTRVVILTTFGRAGYLRRAMEAGALGFVVKDAPAEQLADAVRRVAAGQRVVDPELAAATLAAGVSPLTARERDVLVAARDGSTAADIAARLYLTEGTVRNYLSAAITKTGTRNRAEAVRSADSNGWL